MNAIVYDRHGSPEVLQSAEVGRPTPGTADVLVKVRAVSTNLADWHMIRGEPCLARLERSGVAADA